ncbi:hypothetical protein BaRGS_00011216 [Batillaria attramentaria]|uniref:Uncharacterized protein n=1 Tax=Batillaria attramentaria TaxID=370345 RepID=A0ABD0LDK9_9CAEN
MDFSFFIISLWNGDVSWFLRTRNFRKWRWKQVWLTDFMNIHTDLGERLGEGERPAARTATAQAVARGFQAYSTHSHSTGSCQRLSGLQHAQPQHRQLSEAFRPTARTATAQAVARGFQAYSTHSHSTGSCQRLYHHKNNTVGFGLT